MAYLHNKNTKIALTQVFVPKLALKAKSHKNSTQGVGFRKNTKIALTQVFVPKLALKAKSHKNSTQGVGFRKVPIKLIIPSTSTSHYEGKFQSTREKKWYHHQLLPSQKPLMTLNEIFL
ncbi:hypothetical protein YC2023_111833 [Brassica napus]